ncbi:hypothetical protein Q4571_16870 [Bacillus thuringiensis]|nr:hypothetical protein [Bacillus thuringiensis]
MKKKSTFKKKLKLTATSVTTAGVLLTSLSPSYAEVQIKTIVPTQEKKSQGIDKLQYLKEQEVGINEDIFNKSIAIPQLATQTIINNKIQNSINNVEVYQKSPMEIGVKVTLGQPIDVSKNWEIFINLKNASPVHAYPVNARNV